MKLLRLFALLVIFAGIWSINASASTAHRPDTCLDDYFACMGDADTEYEHCIERAGGIIAFEAICEANHDGATSTCESNYEACQ